MVIFLRNVFKNCIIALVALCMFSSVAGAAAWLQVNENRYVDVDSLQSEELLFKHDRIYKLWFKNTAPEQLADKNAKKIAHKLFYSFFNFANKKITLQTVVEYDAAGNVINSVSADDFSLRWNPVVPDTVGEGLYEIAELIVNANKGDSNAQLIIAGLFDRQQDYDNAAIWFKKAADNGNLDGQFMLGGYYLVGFGVEQDPEKGYLLIKDAAAKGNELANAAMEIVEKNIQTMHEMDNVLQ